MNEIIVLEGLTAIKNRINLSSGFAHPNDKGCTIEMLRRLKNAGYLLDSLFIRDWALQNGFKVSDAEKLKEYVEGVNLGKKYRIGSSPYWKDDIIDFLEQKHRN